MRALALPGKHPIVADFSVAWPYFAQQLIYTDRGNPLFLVRTEICLWNLSSVAETSLHFELRSPSGPKTNIPTLSKEIAKEYNEINFSHNLCMYTDRLITPGGDTGAAIVVPKLKHPKRSSHSFQSHAGTVQSVGLWGVHHNLAVCLRYISLTIVLFSVRNALKLTLGSKTLDNIWTLTAFLTCSRTTRKYISLQ